MADKPYIFRPLASRYEEIVDECMALAAAWRDRIVDSSSDKNFHADQHRRCILRAARFARLAEKVRQVTTLTKDS